MLHPTKDFSGRYTERYKLYEVEGYVGPFKLVQAEFCKQLSFIVELMRRMGKVAFRGEKGKRNRNCSLGRKGVFSCLVFRYDLF